jgi:citrate lyase subunit beta / citryl-CoA lyase
VIIDPEDAVAPQDKEASRIHIAEWEGRASVIVRINGADGPWFIADIEMVLRSGVTMLMVPKADPAALDLVVGLVGDSSDRNRRRVRKSQNHLQKANCSSACFGNLGFGVDAGVTEAATRPGQTSDRPRIEACQASRTH